MWCVCERDRGFRACARLKNGVCVIYVCTLCVFKKERDRTHVQAIGRVMRERVRERERVCERELFVRVCLSYYGVALASRIDKITGLFCKRAL